MRCVRPSFRQLSCALVALVFAFSPPCGAEDLPGDTEAEMVSPAPLEESFSLELSYLSAPECPDLVYIKKKLTGWLGEPLAFEKPLHVQAESRFDGKTWQVSVLLDYGGERGERVVALETCTEAADYIALSVALAVEPQFVNPELSGESDADPEESKDSPSEAGAGQLAGKAPEEVVRGPAPPSEAALKEKRAVLFEGNLTFLATTAPLPGLHWGGHVGLGIHWRGWLAKVGFGLFPPFRYEDDRAENAVRLANYFAQFSVCRDLLEGALFLGPCAGGQLGILTAQEIVSGAEEPAGGRPFWAALSLGAQLSLPLSQNWGLVIVPALVVPLTRPNLQLEGPSGVTLYQPHPGFQGEVGFFLSF